MSYYDQINLHTEDQKNNASTFNEPLEKIINNINEVKNLTEMNEAEIVSILDLLLNDYTTTEQLNEILNNGIRGDKGETGVGLNFDWNGTSLGVKREDETDFIYSDLKGEKGDSGLQEDEIRSIIDEEVEDLKNISINGKQMWSDAINGAIGTNLTSTTSYEDLKYYTVNYMGAKKGDLPTGDIVNWVGIPESVISSATYVEACGGFDTNSGAYTGNAVNIQIATTVYKCTIISPYSTTTSDPYIQRINGETTGTTLTIPCGSIAIFDTAQSFTLKTGNIYYG